jgi:UDP-glucuronate decarboxylase
LEITGSKSRVVLRELPEDDPKVRQPDISLAKAKLGWEPKVDIHDALVRTVEWFKSAMNPGSGAKD